MTTQVDVISVVLDEREYQDERWGLEGHHETGAYLSFIQHYVTRAMSEITVDNHMATLHSVRKIAALAVACMEDNGISKRIT